MVAGTARKTNTAPVAAPASAQDGNIQVIKTVYTYSKDFVLNQFIVKAGQPVGFEVEAQEDVPGCVGSITVPVLTDKIDLIKREKTSVLELTPVKTGKYPLPVRWECPEEG